MRYLLYLALFFSIPLSAEEFCGILPGIWVGENIYENGGTYSKYETHRFPEGKLEIYFIFSEPDGSQVKEVYQGEWSCIDDVMYTTTTDESGVTGSYSYRIIEATASYIKYQVFLEEHLGPIFEATKIKSF